jgi:plastocyanin
MKPGLRLGAFAAAAAIVLPLGPGMKAHDTADVRGTAHVGGRPAPHVVVWLEGAAPAPVAPPARVVLDQRNLAFAPRVLAVRVGTTVEFPNNDRVFHNVFSFRDGKRFDLGLYPVGTSRRVTFDRAGLSRIFCNIHPNMAAYVVAVDSPYYAVSDQSGAFTIGGVPRGTYKYTAWRAGAAEIQGTWSFPDSSSEPAALAIEWP